MYEVISNDLLLFRGQRTQGFGLDAHYTPCVDNIIIVDTVAFDEIAARNKPSGYQTMGFNQGAPLDGLVKRTTKDGIRLLVDATGSGMIRKYADRKTVQDAIRMGAVSH